MSKRSWRKIVVRGVEWKYFVGHGAVEARCGERKIVEQLHRVTGGTPNDFERGQHKRTSDGMITPKRISAWIETADKDPS